MRKNINDINERDMAYDDSYLNVPTKVDTDGEHPLSFADSLSTIDDLEKMSLEEQIEHLEQELENLKERQFNYCPWCSKALH